VKPTVAAVANANTAFFMSGNLSSFSRAFKGQFSTGKSGKGFREGGALTAAYQN
jgi:hypothetical protein